MALVEWSQRYSVGVNAMDAQHQKLFGILNRLHDAMLVGKAREIQHGIVAEMTVYARNHFAQEELLMQTRGYPKLAEHRQQHLAFSMQVKELEKKLQAGSAVVTVEMMDFLRKWLSNHILAVDVRYGEWMRPAVSTFRAALPIQD